MLSTTKKDSLFRIAVESSATGMMMVDEQGLIMLVNAQVEKLFGYDRTELIGQSIEILVPERFRSHHPKFRSAFFSDPKARPMGAGRDLYGLRKDETEIPIEIGLNPLETPEGRFVLASVVDISERKRGVEQFRLALEAAPTGMMMVNEQGLIVLVNAQVEKLFGYDRTELIGQSIEILVPERFRSHHPKFRSAFFSDPKARPMGAGRDLYGLRKDETEIPIEIGLNPLKTPEGRFVLTSVVDISERRGAGEALRQSEERFRLMVGAVKDYAILMLDPEGNVVNWNVGAERLKGYQAAEITGKHFSCFYLPEDINDGKPQQQLKLAAAEGRFEDEGWRVRNDGSTFWASVVITPVRDQWGKLLGFTKVTQDLTERKRAEQVREALVEELRMFNTQLEERVRERTAELRGTLREREVLLQEIHHRVKNNLQVISSLINLQLRRIADQPSRRALQECQTRVQAIALIHEMLYRSADYSRILFSEYAYSLAGSVFHAAGTTSDSISLELAIADISLSVDKAIPCALILNELIINALKHAFPNGRSGIIRIELGRIEPNQLLLTIKDDGVGVPPEFDVRQSHSLGMQLVCTLAEQLGAQLEIVRGTGTTFNLTFAIDEVPSQELSPQFPLARAGQL